jgi:hypothetical protein
MKENSNKKLIRAVRKLTAEIEALRQTLGPERKPAAKKAKTGKKKKTKRKAKKAGKAKPPAASAGEPTNSAVTIPN